MVPVRLRERRLLKKHCLIPERHGKLRRRPITYWIFRVSLNENKKKNMLLCFPLLRKIYQCLVFPVCRGVCSDINHTEQFLEHSPFSAFGLEIFESQQPLIMMSSLAPFLLMRGNSSSHAIRESCEAPLSYLISKAERS